MPNLNEITKFREDLKNIAHEDEITARWGERVYDELPLPDPAEVPDIDLDALLPAEAKKPADGGGDPSEALKTEPIPEKPTEPSSDMFDTVPVTDVPDISTETPFPADFDDSGDRSTGSGEPSGADNVPGAEAAQEDTESIHIDDASAVEPSQSDLPGTKSDEPEIVSGDAYPVDEEGMPDTSDMDAFLSSFNFDDMSGDDAGSSDMADSETSEQTPAEGGDSSDFDADFDNMLSSFDFDSEPIKIDERPSTDDTVPEDVETLDEHDEVPADDTLQEERTIPDITIPDIDLSALDSLSDDISRDSEAPAALDEPDEFPNPKAALNMDEDEETAQFPVSDETSVLETPAASDTAAGDSDTSDNLENMEELSLFSENRDEPVSSDVESSDDGFEFSMDAPDSNPIDISPISNTDVGFDSVGMPEHVADTFFTQQENDSSDQSGFSLEENPLESEITEVADDQFNLPDNFKDFSADTHTQMFDSVIAKSTGSSEEDEVLTISDDDYFNFLNRLESFPFNVQLAIQDYIANGDDRPENKMNFIRFVLEKDSLKKVVNKLEKIINRSIPIPRGFQRKSVEEYEKEKQTFKYWFMHRFLPVAVMSAIALILIFCISVLSWQFIYKPVTAESLYKTGYSYLESGRYETAVEKFNQAGEYKRKKKWYFSYARAFRAKKQFTAAEKMYLRLIYDFNNDKQGGLEYADMLSTDLRNYEKAETVLRRRVLDQHVNDKDGMLALGDVYMNWADEDPAKYGDAVKIYSRLIELYGENDTFLLRMMRYFIRTDNLAEVLNLKDHSSSQTA